MQSHRNTLLTAALAALLILAHSDVASARPKKSGSSGDLGIQTDANGVPIIMKGFRSDRPGKTRPDTTRSDTARSGKQAAKPVRIPRGSSTYIPPPMPSAMGSPSGVSSAPMVQPYNPPPITTFGDKVNNAIHSYPLNKGIGNNPTDMQMYIRQNSN